MERVCYNHEYPVQLFDRFCTLLCLTTCPPKSQTNCCLQIPLRLGLESVETVRVTIAPSQNLHKGCPKILRLTFFISFDTVVLNIALNHSQKDRRQKNIIFIRPGRSQGLLYKFNNHKFAPLVTLCPPLSLRRRQAKAVRDRWGIWF